MNYTLLLSASILIIIFSIFSKNNKKIKLNKNDNESKVDTDLNSKFINNSDSKIIIDAIRVYNPIDGSILRSILDSYDICTYSKFNSLNNLYPGIQINGHTTSIISIFENDLTKLIPIFNDYVQNLKKVTSTNKKNKFINISEFIISGQCMPRGRDRRFPELIINNLE